MGANQSSRSQLGAARHHQHQQPHVAADSSINGGTLKISRQINNNNNNNKQQHKSAAGLGSSLRKSVSNVLATTNRLSGSKCVKSSSQLNGARNSSKSPKTNRLANLVVDAGPNGLISSDDVVDGQSAQLNQSTDSYYVSSERQHVAASAISKSGRMIMPATASKANNYVCMQQTNATITAPPATELDCRESRREGSVEPLNGGFNSNNNNYNIRPTYGGKSDASVNGGGLFYVANEQPLPVELLNPVKDGSFISGAQDHRQYNTIHNEPEHHIMGALGRSSHQQQQQQLHHHQTKAQVQQPFVHLSRAVNTKTKRVLNNSNVSMPNGNISGNSFGRRQQQQHYLAANNNDASSSLLVQNSPQQHPHQLYHHQVQSTPQTSGRKSSSSYLYQCASDQQFYSSPSLAYRAKLAANEPQSSLFNPSSQLDQTSSPLSHKRQQQRTSLTCGGFEDSENSLPASISSNQQQHQYYLRNLALLGPQQTDLDLDQQQQVQMNALQRRYNQSGQKQYQQQLIDFHQPNQQRDQHQRLSGLNDQLTLDCRNYTRSHSFGGGGGGGSRTLEAKKKNPLAALFQNSSTKSTHSNTIHLGRQRNKSSILPNYFTAASSSAATNNANQRSCPGSLKRIKPAPLTAQQASYEAMRTIDMYLIRQIARSCMDFEMEQKIDLEIRLRELAAQSMLEAQDEIDVLEVEKSLLTSDQRMNCYASLLEDLRKQLSNPSLSTTDSGRGSKSGNHRHQLSSPSRPDVIGTTATNETGALTSIVGGGTNTSATTTATTTTNSATSTSGVASSPSFSSSVSNSQSPSKLSPVSGESANSPSFTTNSSQHSRQLGLRSQSSAAHNQSAKQRVKNKQREQLMQNITSLSNIDCNMVINNRASVSVSEIRIPLMWRDVDHFKNRGDYKRFAIFCLLKIDSQIYDTQLICDVDRQVTDVTFDDLVVFNEIDHSFELTLEVYTCVYLEEFSLSSTPRKLKEKLTSSVSRAMGRRLATQTASTNYTKELQAYDKSYRFALIANATLRLNDASDSVKTYDLVLVSPSAHHRHYHHHHGDYNLAHRTVSNGSNQAMDGSNQSANSKDADKNTLPLFGHFCCKLSVRPDVFDKNIKTGYLRVAAINVPNNNNNISVGSYQNSHSGSSDRVSDSPLNTTTDSCHDAVVSGSASNLRLSLAASSKMATLSMSTSRVHWGLLRNFTLHLWPIDDQDLELALRRGELPLLDNPNKPRLTLAIDKYTRLLRVSNSSLTIETDKGCFVLGVYYPETNLYGAGLNYQADEISHWLRTIEQFIYDSHIWGTALSHYPPHTRSSTSTRLANNNNNTKRTSSKHQKHQQRYYGGGGAVLHADV